MARPLRIQFPGAFYHVMNRGISHAPIFDGAWDRALFKKTLADAVRLWKIRIHAYALMDNHYHLLIETPLANLSRAMQHINGIYTQRFNRQHHRDGPLMRGRFKAILVHHETYFLELVRYIHLNGVRAFRFPSARVDRDCSHPDYLSPNKSPLWLERNFTLSHFSYNAEELDRFVHDGVSEKLAALLNKKRWPAILGPKDFVAKIRTRFLKSRSHREIPQVAHVNQMTLSHPNELMIACIENFEGEENNGQQELTTRREMLWATMSILRQNAHLTFGEIAKLVGLNSADAVEKFLKRNSYCDGAFFKKMASN